MDRFSNLPDEILCQILSFLPIKEAAALTSCLSKRWRDLFAFRQDLCLRYVDFWDPKINRSGFTDFVDRVLAVSGNSTMRKFSLEIYQSVESAHINRWMINMLSRGIVDLELYHFVGDVISLPLEVFTCNTLVKLKLGRDFSIAMVPENASLPALKTLCLHHVRFSELAFEALLSACHVLEELTLLGHNWGRKKCKTVSCPTLQRLTLSCGFSSQFDVSFDTPRLVYLQYYGSVANEYPVVNLNSLVEAELYLRMKFNGDGNLANLLKGLRNVEILNLSSLETSKVLYRFAEAIPVFKNLTRLSIATASGKCWPKLMQLLLKKSPNLETLVIKGPLHFSGQYGEHIQWPIGECLSEYSFLSSCLVKVLEITEYYGTTGELGHMKHILKKFPCLELVIVHASAKEISTYTTDLLMLPRPSKIQFKFFPSALNT